MKNLKTLIAIFLIVSGGVQASELHNFETTHPKNHDLCKKIGSNQDDIQNTVKTIVKKTIEEHFPNMRSGNAKQLKDFGSSQKRVGK